MQAYAWDWFISMPEEWTVLRRSGMTLPNIVYAISRYVYFPTLVPFL